MPAPPLTHHDILGLIEPFTRRGRHADLAASDRLERRLVFRAIDLEQPGSGIARLRESLRLENPQPGSYRLTRSLVLEVGLVAELVAEGSEPATLLERIEAVLRTRQFACGPGYRIAWSHRLEGSSDELILTGATLRAGGLAISVRAPAVRGASAEIELIAAPGDPLNLPEDLFAVLGRDFSLLRRGRESWRGSLWLRGGGAARGERAQLRVVAAAQQLVRTLEEPPVRFHERWLGARWRVTLRRASPVLASIVLVLGAAGASRLELAQDSAFRMLLFNAPPLLLVLVFCMRGMPRFELPPLPRRPLASTWRSVEPREARP